MFSSPKNNSLKDVKSHSILYGNICDPETGDCIDEVLITVMKSPRSYTREDVVEINCHGGMVTLRRALELVIRQGARLAEPGEFTRRAFLNGRIDLSQAEAVLDLIRSRTDESRRIALEQLHGVLSEKITSLRDGITELCVNIEAYIDFPEEEIGTASVQEVSAAIGEIIRDLEKLLKTYDEAKFFREGMATAIVGKPNVGKSSLLNALLKKDRAIVTEMPGTTRDVIEEYLNIKGLPLRIMDTAGIRDVTDSAEREGVKRSLRSIVHADLVVAVFDASEPLSEEDFEVIQKVKDKNAVFVLNKSDLPPAVHTNSFSSFMIHPSSLFMHVSATQGNGIEELQDAIFTACLKEWKEEREGVVVTNIRHKSAIEDATAALRRAERALTDNQPIEITALELRDALDKLGEIVGAVTAEDILNRIFSDFCIGK
jgi:tRNA modification GTPase